eukprot:5828570-Lingulodinium_polyedra.AAC.1
MQLSSEKRLPTNAPRERRKRRLANRLPSSSNFSTCHTCTVRVWGCQYRPETGDDKSRIQGRLRGR